MFKKTITRLVPYLPSRLVEKIAARYIAGKTVEQALRVSRSLSAQGFGTTLDILGEDTMNLSQAGAAADAYIDLLDRLKDGEATRNVSVKLTQLGLRIDETAAVDNLTRLLEHAQTMDAFVRIDMEDASLTDVTLGIYRTVQDRGYNTGTVLQARLKRTRADAAALKNASIRLCKGAYKEADAVAYERQRDIRRSYMDVFHTLIENGCRTAVATHDLKLISRVRTAIERESIPKDRVEFQSLLGVPIRKTLEELRADGFAVRLYVPFGDASMSYSIRRLNENPDLATAIVKSLLRRDRFDAAGLGAA